MRQPLGQHGGDQARHGPARLGAVQHPSHRGGAGAQMLSLSGGGADHRTCQPGVAHLRFLQQCAQPTVAARRRLTLATHTLATVRSLGAVHRGLSSGGLGSRPSYTTITHNFPLLSCIQVPGRLDRRITELYSRAVDQLGNGQVVGRSSLRRELYGCEVIWGRSVQRSDVHRAPRWKS
jgi:hypothetical protein